MSEDRKKTDARASPVPTRVPRRTPHDPSFPSSRHSQRERSTTRSGSRSPRACRRGERRRTTSSPSTRAPSSKWTRPRTVATHPRRLDDRPLTPPHAVPFLPQIRGDPRDLSRGASQAAHGARGLQGARARYPDPRPISDLPSDRSTPTKAAGGRFTDASQFDDGATDRSPQPPLTRDPSTRPRRPRRGSPAERPAPTSP